MTSTYYALIKINNPEFIVSKIENEISPLQTLKQICEIHDTSKFTAFYHTQDLKF